MFILPRDLNLVSHLFDDPMELPLYQVGMGLGETGLLMELDYYYFLGTNQPDAHQWVKDALLDEDAIRDCVDEFAQENGLEKPGLKHSLVLDALSTWREIKEEQQWNLLVFNQVKGAWRDHLEELWSTPSPGGELMQELYAEAAGKAGSNG